MDGEEAALEIGGTEDVGTNDSDVSMDDSSVNEQPNEQVGAEADAKVEGQEPKEDGRKVQAAVRSHLAELKKANPSLAKELERIYWKGQNIDKLGTTQELTALKEAVELHGGVESLATMAEEVEAGRQLEEGFKAGDPKVIEGWAKDYPDGFKKLILPAVERLAQLDPKFHEQTVSTIATKFFETYGVFDGVGQLGDALRNGKIEDAVRLYNDLVGKVFSPMRNLATKAAENPYKDREAELNDREAKIGEQAKQAFFGGVRQEVNQQVGRAMNAEIAKLLRGTKLGPEMGNRVRSEVTAEIKQLLIAQADYAKRYETIMASNDREKATKFVVDNAVKNMPKAVQTVLKYRNLLGANGNVARTATKGAAKPGVTPTVAGRPNIADVDFERTDKATFLGSRQHGQAFLKSGKIAK